MSRLGQTVKVSGGGGAISSGRIYLGSSPHADQLAGGGFAWDGTDNSAGQYWDDAGYWQTYGDRAGEWFNPAAVVAIVPVAGRYRYTFQSSEWCSAIGITAGSYIFVFIESDPVPGNAWSWMKLVVTDGSSWADGIEWIGWLDAGGCVGIQTSIGTTDSLNVNSYQTIEKIG